MFQHFAPNRLGFLRQAATRAVGRPMCTGAEFRRALRADPSRGRKLPLRDISVAHVDAPTRMPAGRSFGGFRARQQGRGHREAIPARRLTGRQKVRLSRSPGVIRVAALGTNGGLGISDICNIECGPAVMSRMVSILGLGRERAYVASTPARF